MTTINTMEDLMQLLDGNPEWLEAVRARVLTRELLELPELFRQQRAEFMQLTAEFAQHRADFAQHLERFDRLSGEFTRHRVDFVRHLERFDRLLAEVVQLRADFVQHLAQFDRLAVEFAQHRAEFVRHLERFDRLLEEFAEHRAEFARHQDRFMQLADEFAQHRAEFIEHRRDLSRDLSQVKAGHALYMSSRMGPHFAQELGLRYRRKVEMEDLAAMTHNRTELTRGQRKSFNLSDLVFVAAEEDGEECYVVVEVSYTANGRDSQRALEHAGMLTRFTGQRALAAVAATRYDYDLQPLLDSGRLHWLELEVRDLEPE